MKVMKAWVLQLYKGDEGEYGSTTTVAGVFSSKKNAEEAQAAIAGAYDKVLRERGLFHAGHKPYDSFSIDEYSLDKVTL